jgi:hypothetical protein
VLLRAAICKAISKGCVLHRREDKVLTISYRQLPAVLVELREMGTDVAKELADELVLWVRTVLKR